MALKLYDTLAREERLFVPRRDGAVGMYVCGPTVQAASHIGHGRAAVVFDVLRRYLEFGGLNVTFVQNITDIDDKIIFRANAEKVTAAQIATRYTRIWNETMAALNVLPPTVQPHATGHLIEMFSLIEQLIDAGYAYAVDGDVFFRVRKFATYGALSRRVVDDMQQGDDVIDADRKEDQLDFALWKSAKPDEPSWLSPWGEGRPGWHIECSAMAAKHLADGVDIHGGGFDLVFPHHENEIAQHEAAHGTTFANYWVHNGMVRMGAEKMSKSLGNVIALRGALDTWGPGPLRVWYLSAQHRTPLTFDDDRLSDAEIVFNRFVTCVRSARRLGDGEVDAAAASSYRDKFVAAMDDDLNVPVAVSVLHELVTDANAALTKANNGDPLAQATVRSLGGLLVTLADDVFGLGVEAALDQEAASETLLAPFVADVLAQRRTARSEKDYAAADRLRDQLAQAGVVVEDSPDGERWYVQPPSGNRT
ncbi:MAG: cysteine--tRNA ligase [Nitriliruptoraceae bacterium]